MCGIVGFLDRSGRVGHPTGRVVLDMLRALACRGPDSAGVALLGDGDESAWAGLGQPGWWARIAPADLSVVERLGDQGLGRLIGLEGSARGGTLRFQFLPEPGVTPDDLERALGARRGGLEVLGLGRSLDLVKQVGSPEGLEMAYGISAWTGLAAIGHTRMSTESRIDLSHSQPFWAHGLPDVATAHNGHVTNYHKLRRMYERRGVTFYTDNDSEVIGVYLRDRMARGRSLAEAMSDSIDDLDGAFTYLVLAPEGLGVARDRFGFKPLMLAETDDWVAAATEEVALRRALPGSYRVVEPPPGVATLHPLPSAAVAAPAV